jgi:hypothetical protein
MTMRAAVERAVVVEDEYGQPGPPAWGAYIAALPCWLYSSAEREVMGEKTAVIEDLKLLVPKATDITERDRLNGVVDRRGVVISPGVHIIESVQRRKRHLELSVRRIAA